MLMRCGSQFWLFKSPPTELSLTMMWLCFIYLIGCQLSSSWTYYDVPLIFACSLFRSPPTELSCDYDVALFLISDWLSAPLLLDLLWCASYLWLFIIQVPSYWAFTWLWCGSVSCIWLASSSPPSRLTLMWLWWLMWLWLWLFYLICCSGPNCHVTLMWR
jgi:hypothetical protein